MFINDMDHIQAKEITAPSALYASMKVLVGPDQGWDSHVMRAIELETGGYSPKHEHPWPHINYVIEGEGILSVGGEEKEIKKGSIAFVPPGQLHQFKNTGKEKLAFICIVPKEGHQ